MDAKTIRLDLTAVNTQGEQVLSRTLTADTVLRDKEVTADGKGYRVIDIRLMVPRLFVDEALHALRTGSVEIVIDSVAHNYVAEAA